MKKTFLTTIIALAALISLNSCSGASDKGADAAAKLSLAWGNADAIRKVASDYIAARDSLTLPGEDWMMNNAFFEACGDNDSLLVMAQAIALDATEFGKENGKVIVSGLQDGSLDATTAAGRLGIMDMALSVLGRNDQLSTCFNAIEEAVQTLPEDQQMVVYTRSCTPAKLGDALKQDRATDSLKADRQAAIVGTILKGEELETFKSHYYNR